MSNQTKRLPNTDRLELSAPDAGDGLEALEGLGVVDLGPLTDGALEGSDDLVETGGQGEPGEALSLACSPHPRHPSPGQGRVSAARNPYSVPWTRDP